MRAAGDHHPEVDHLVVVAAQDHADDVLADVVDVALDRGHHDLALAPLGLRASLLPGQLLLRLHERFQVGDRALHHPGALDHLGQEHLARAEQVADDLHAVHQRALDDLQRAVGTAAGLLGVGLDVVDDAVHERVLRAGRTGALRQARSTTRFVPALLTVSANATSRSVASARRSKMTSSTSSSRSAGMSA
jgi:hypothetical protein